jgi:hypothetical protein
VTFALDLPGSAVLTVTQSKRDALPVDDAAALVLPSPSRPRIALVHPSDRDGRDAPETGTPTGRGAAVAERRAGPEPFLHDVLAATDPAALRSMTIEAFDALAAAAESDEDRFDLVVFDRVSPARGPDAPTLSFGAVPPLRGVGTLAPRRAGGRPVISWDRQHALLRHVGLDSLVFAGFGAFELGAEAAGIVPLAFGPDGPVIIAQSARGVRHVAVGFSLQQSNWPLHISFTVFMQNAMDILTGAGRGADGLVFRPGDVFTVEASMGVDRVRVEGAGSWAVEVPVVRREPVTLPPLRRAGVYTAAGARPPHDRIALSVLSEIESDVRPRDRITVNAADAGSASAAEAAPLELWPWLAAAGFLLLIVEWLLYLARARGWA